MKTKLNSISRFAHDWIVITFNVWITWLKKFDFLKQSIFSFFIYHFKFTHDKFFRKSFIYKNMFNIFILYNFIHSSMMLNQLIQYIAWTSSNVKHDSFLKFIDRSIAILNRIFNVYWKHILTQHIVQKRLIMFEFRDLKMKMNDWFHKIKKNIDERLKTKNEKLKKTNERIERMKQKMNNCFENVIKRYIQQENKI